MTSDPGYDKERSALQAFIGLAGIVPVAVGAAGSSGGLAFLHDGGSGFMPDIAVDSHVRYLSGLLLAIGLAFWATIPGVERHAARIRLLTAIVVAGGLARLSGTAVQGYPGFGMTFGLIMELLVTPALCIWQARIARRDPARR